MTSDDAASDRLGIPREAVDRLVQRLEDEGLDPHALMITRGGTIAFEAAWAPYRSGEPALVYSVSKTWTALAIGLLVDDGLLQVGDDAGAILGLPNPHGITVRHLLTMNTGHTPEQIDGLGMDPATLLSTPPAHAPGSFFAYNSDATYALSCIVTAVTGERVTDVLRPRLLDPLGIGARWMAPWRGLEQGYSGYHLTVHDLARVGTLLCDGGVRDGRRLVSRAFLDELAHAWSDTSAHEDRAPDDDWTLGYGYQVWRSTHGFRLDGAYGQFGLVVPDLDLVIAYQGATMTTQATLRAFWELVDAVAAAGAAFDPAAGIVRPDEVVRDSWESRDRLVPAPDGAMAEAAGWSLDEAAVGWTLTMPELGAIAVAPDDWARTVLTDDRPEVDDRPQPVPGPATAPGRAVHVAARGERRPDGGVRVHVVSTTSPHRILVDAADDGRLTAAWHTVPLQERRLGILRVPA